MARYEDRRTGIERVGETSLKATGKRVRYLYKDSWNRRYYSFDMGRTWNRSKAAAYLNRRED